VTQSSTLIGADSVKRRVMFAIEFIDPVTKALAGAAMIAAAEGLARPRLTRAGQLVWTDIDPPAARQVKVSAHAVRKQFKAHDATIDVPARTPNVAVHVEKVTLVPTGLYEPPDGRLAVAGMLVDGAGEPIPKAGVRLLLRAADDQAVLPSTHEAETDERGGFVTVDSDLGDETPLSSPPPAAEGGLVGWLVVTVSGVTRHTALLPLRRGRLFRIPAPLVWTNLPLSAPPWPPP
jgi:hypothetical protein